MKSVKSVIFYLAHARVLIVYGGLIHMLVEQDRGSPTSPIAPIEGGGKHKGERTATAYPYPSHSRAILQTLCFPLLPPVQGGKISPNYLINMVYIRACPI